MTATRSRSLVDGRIVAVGCRSADVQTDEAHRLGEPVGEDMDGRLDGLGNVHVGIVARTESMMAA
jgi:hypothetical protein